MNFDINTILLLNIQFFIIVWQWCDDDDDDDI